MMTSTDDTIDEWEIVTKPSNDEYKGEEEEKNNNTVQSIYGALFAIFGVKMSDLDEFIIALLQNSITNVCVVIPVACNILKQKAQHTHLQKLLNEIKATGDNLESMVRNMNKNKSYFQSLLDFAAPYLPKKFDPFLKFLKGSNISKEDLEKCMKEMGEKIDELKENIDPQKIQESLEDACNAHIVFSVISLIISWVHLCDTLNQITDTSEKIKKIQLSLDKLRKEEITPIAERLKKLKKENGYLSTHEYELYCKDIKSAVNELKHLRNQVIEYRNNMKKKQINSVINGVTMVASAVTSYGLMKAAGGFTVSVTTKALGVLSAAQAISAAANFRAVVLTKQVLNELYRLEIELQDKIDELEDIQKEFKKYVSSVSDWNKQKVISWIKSNIGAEVAKVFEAVDGGVDGKDLLNLNDDMLKDFGIAAFHRKKILRSIEELKMQ